MPNQKHREGKGRSWKGYDSEGQQRRMMAKGEGDDGEGRRQRTTQEPADAGKFILRLAKNKGAVRQSCDSRSGGRSPRGFEKWDGRKAFRTNLPCPSRASGLIGVLDGATDDAEAKTTGGGDGDGGRWRWKREEATAMEEGENLLKDEAEEATKGECCEKC